MITFEEIDESLSSLDTEYREALASAAMKLKYISDSPLQLSYGSEKQQDEWDKFNTRPLKADEIKNLIQYIQGEMKGDFQYGSFSRIASEYLEIAKAMQIEDNSKHRMLDNGMYVMDLGYRSEQPIALVERTFKDGTKEYIIAFNYEIKDNKIDWGYGYYYSENIDKAKNDFKRALNGESLADTFSEKAEESKDEFNLVFYTEEEIKDLIKSKAELYYVDDGVDEAIIRFEDIPDFIVDYNRKLEMRDLKFFKVGKEIYEPDITTYGEFLNTIKPELREQIIDRLVALQRNEIEPKKYKIIDEDVFSQIKDKVEQEQAKLRKQKKKNREVR